MKADEADRLRDAAMNVPAFRDGYDATMKWLDSIVGTPAPVNPHPTGTGEHVSWMFGAEQAELEGCSPDSWRDGGAGLTGVLTPGFVVVELRAEVLKSTRQA